MAVHHIYVRACILCGSRCAQNEKVYLRFLTLEERVNKANRTEEKWKEKKNQFFGIILVYNT